VGEKPSSAADGKFLVSIKSLFRIHGRRSGGRNALTPANAPLTFSGLPCADSSKTALAYNLRRAFNILGMEKLMAALAA